MDHSKEWQELQTLKGSLETDCEEYARLTLPYLCPPSEENSPGEIATAAVPFAPRLVNHLSNRVVDTMFPQDRPFFTLQITDENKEKIAAEVGKDDAGKLLQELRSSTARIENAAMSKMDLTSYRPRAIEAVKHLIVTGNVAIRRLKDGKRVVYGVKDFACKRDLRGSPVLIMLRDMHVFSGLPDEAKAVYRTKYPHTEENTKVALYTKFVRDGSRWVRTQSVEDIAVGSVARFNEDTMPVLVLTWSLSRGMHYGRSLVADYLSAFQNLEAAEAALIDTIEMQADIRILVSTRAQTDVEEFNRSSRGSYHAGNPEDLTPTTVGDLSRAIAQFREVIQGWQRELAQAFLMNSAAVRDAERVTAEEIRYISQELNTAYGGLYSRLAVEWQRHEANYVLADLQLSTDARAIIDSFNILITTGLENLSREGQLANLRNAINDISMLDAIPEDVRSDINKAKVVEYIFSNWGVPFEEFLLTGEEKAAAQEAAMQQQQALMGMETDSALQQEAGKAAIAETANAR